MNRLVYLLVFVVVLVSCETFRSKEEHRFIYGFENESKVSNIELQNTIAIIKKRLVKFGVKPEVKRFAQKQIEVIIRANKLNTDRINKLICNQGKLEFWELYEGSELFNYTYEVFYNIVETGVDGKSEVKSDFELFPSYQGSPIVFLAKAEDTAAITSRIEDKVSRLSLPLEYKNVKFLWGLSEDGRIPLYAAKSNRENKPPLTGEIIVEAQHIYGVTGQPEVSMRMNQKGALIWERMTEKAFQNRTSIAIVLNDIVFSAPRVASGPIVGGRSSISGNFTKGQAQDLAVILSSGQSIPKLKLLEHTVVSNR